MTNSVSNGVSHTTPTRPDPISTGRGINPNPFTDNDHYHVARRIAASQMSHLDALAMTGKVARLDGEERRVVAVSLELAARDVLER